MNKCIFKPHEYKINIKSIVFLSIQIGNVGSKVKTVMMKNEEKKEKKKKKNQKFWEISALTTVLHLKKYIPPKST